MWLRPERSASRARAQESVRDGPVTGRPWCSISAVRSVPERFNVAEFFVDRHVAEGRGGRRAFRAGGRVVTYGEVADHVARAAGALGAAGLDSEQRALLALNDSPAFAAAFWGAAKLGAVSVPVKGPDFATVGQGVQLAEHQVQRSTAKDAGPACQNHVTAAT